ncbi:hypothetical protein CWC16_19505, partial [Pseudoalteromonas sp. S3776]|uniref:WD40 repeat domain-containing protein n=1 Tax=Pseudoalteromonas sp. S3776 TaxID=579544 RepID=UPI001278085F
LHTLTEATDWMQSVAYNPDGTRLAAGGFDRKVRIYDGMIPASPLHTIEARGFVYSVAYSPDGTYLAAGGADNMVRIYDGMAPASPLHTIDAATEWVQERNSVVYRKIGKISVDIRVRRINKKKIQAGGV